MAETYEEKQKRLAEERRKENEHTKRRYRLDKGPNQRKFKKDGRLFKSEPTIKGVELPELEKEEYE